MSRPSDIVVTQGKPVALVFPHEVECPPAVFTQFADAVPDAGAGRADYFCMALETLIALIRSGRTDFATSKTDGCLILCRIDHEDYTPQGLNPNQVSQLRYKARELLQAHQRLEASAVEKKQVAQPLFVGMGDFLHTAPKMRLFGFYYVDEATTKRPLPRVRLKLVFPVLLDA